MNRREQLAKDNGMTIEFVNWFFDNKKDGCGNAWLVMMAAMWESWKHLSEQRDALAAESAARRDYRPQPQGAAMVEALDAFYDREDVPEQGMMAAFEILCCKRPQPPATDAFLREVRAQGAEACVKALATSDDDDFTDAPNICANVAAELRKGGAA